MFWQLESHQAWNEPIKRFLFVIILQALGGKNLFSIPNSSTLRERKKKSDPLGFREVYVAFKWSEDKYEISDNQKPRASSI